MQVEVSAADFTQQDVAQPACKEAAPGEPAYHTPQPGISMSSNSYDDEPQYCRDPEPDIALAYTVFEPDRSGRLVMEAAEALGLRPGYNLHQLKQGESVVTDSGATVHPEQVSKQENLIHVLA